MLIPKLFKHDPRAKLYLKYLEYVEAFKPLAILMENVPDALNHGGQNIAEETCEVLEQKGYVARYTLLNAAFYGVPQMRERMFLIGYRQELDQPVIFLQPTHWVDLPPGYEGSRSVALKLLSGAGLTAEAFDYVEPPEANPQLPSAITAEEALGDLPSIDARALLRSGELKRGARRFDKPMPYGHVATINDYANLMRAWPGFEAPGSLMDHVIRYLPRDYALFARLNPGDQYPEAWEHAQKLRAIKPMIFMEVGGPTATARTRKPCFSSSSAVADAVGSGVARLATAVKAPLTIRTIAPCAFEAVASEVFFAGSNGTNLVSFSISDTGFSQVFGVNRDVHGILFSVRACQNCHPET